MMFNLFKSKPTLKELIPKGFVDIHSHILPGIDDGAKNVEESIELINNMKEMGFSKIIGTPHTYPGLYENTNESIKESFKKINGKQSGKIKLGYSSEYMMDSSIIEKANKKELLCLKDNYILIEMSFLAPPNELYDIIFNLKINGYYPIMAHPERYLFLHDDFKKYHKLKNHGCYFQMNLLSTTGFYGNNIAKISEKLLRNNMIDYLGSDIHSMRHVREFENKLIINDTISLTNTIENNLFFK